MNYKQQILQEIQYIPEPLLNEIIDFIQFLKQKHQVQEQHTDNETEILETALLSESALHKDWLKPEEDEAWQNL